MSLCHPSILMPVPIHLTNGNNSYEGHVELYYTGQWGTVCDHNWDIVDAKYVCVYFLNV